MWEKADLTLLPPQLRSQLAAFVERGIPPAPFLTGLLANDVTEALEHVAYDATVDPRIGEDIRSVQRFIRRHVPKQAAGTFAKVAAWTRRGGLAGGSPC